MLNVADADRICKFLRALGGEADACVPEDKAHHSGAGSAETRRDLCLCLFAILCVPCVSAVEGPHIYGPRGVL